MAHILTAATGLGTLGLGLMAQTPAASEPLGGWGNLLLQGGAFALLAYIVIRIYPQGTKEARDEREKRDALFGDLITNLQTKFEERNAAVVAELRVQTAALAAVIKESACKAKDG